MRFLKAIIGPIVWVIGFCEGFCKGFCEGVQKTIKAYKDGEL